MISNKCNYALRALLELAKREGAGPATIVDIAQAQQMPARFLEAILRQLKQSGLTDSIRGKHGGYVLARSAREITVAEVVRLVEGPLFTLDRSDSAPRPITEDVFAPLWDDAEAALNEVFSAVSLADLAEMDRERAKNFVLDYTI